MLFRINADTPALNRTGTGHSVWSRHVTSTSLIFMTDASNFQNSTFWDPDTTSGVGGWGDPNDDDQITDGAFADGFIVTYPSPHRLRRRYTPSPSDNPNEILANAFTPESQMALVNGFEGSFLGFQAHLEPGSHRSIHYMVGGCVNLLYALRLCPLTDPPRDLFGNCPSNAPAGCTPGPRWSPNGTPLISDIHDSDISIDPLFMMHHAVRRISGSNPIF